MKNTLENRIKFFTQYWNQVLLRHTDWEEGTWFGIHAKSMLFVEEDGGEGYYIEVKSTNNLTIDDLKKCQFSFSEEAKIEINGEYWKGYSKDGYYLGEGYMLPSNIDYLRSQGFAVPYNGLSVEKQIEYNWIKIVD